MDRKKILNMKHWTINRHWTWNIESTSSMFWFWSTNKYLLIYAAISINNWSHDSWNIDPRPFLTAELDSWGQNWSSMGGTVKSQNFDMILRFYDSVIHEFYRLITPNIEKENLNTDYEIWWLHKTWKKINTRNEL